jgi:hypothetical protein
LARGHASVKLQLKANRRTAEYRISNVEVWNRCAQSLLKWTEFIDSTFDVGRSMFDVHLFIDAKLNMKLYSKFHLRSDWPFFRPEAALNPEPPSTEPLNV